MDVSGHDQPAVGGDVDVVTEEEVGFAGGRLFLPGGCRYYEDRQKQGDSSPGGGTGRRVGLKIRWPSGLEGSSPSPGISIVARLFRVLGINRKHTDLVPGDKLGDKVVSAKSDVYTITRFAPLSF